MLRALRSARGSAAPYLLLLYELWGQKGRPADIRRINDTAVRAKKTGMIILGGGLVKHHTCNANLMVRARGQARHRARPGNACATPLTCTRPVCRLP